MNTNANTNTTNMNPADEIWAMLKETECRLKDLARSQEETKQQMDESWRRTEKSMEESQRRIEKNLGELEKNLGGLGNSLGRLVESMFSAKLCDKLNDFGYLFNTQANHKKYYDNKRVLAEADSILENGEYAMIVEVKTELSADDINEHLERIAT